MNDKKPACAICGEEVGMVSRVIGVVRVCMSCNPFRRCSVVHADGSACLGHMASHPTPNHMGRHVCDMCGNESYGN